MIASIRRLTHGCCECVCGLSRVLWCLPPPIMCGPDMSPGPRCHRGLRSLMRAIRDYCGGTRVTKCIGNYSGLFILFLQSFPFNAKYGIKRTGHLQTIMARLPSQRPDGTQTKVPFAAKEIKEFRLIFSIFLFWFDVYDFTKSLENLSKV